MVSRSLLSLSALALTAALPTIFGPPTLCQPLDIGTAKSLPFGPKEVAIDPKYRIEQLVEDMMDILESSSDAEVHFETLRRTAIYLSSQSHVRRADLHSAGKMAGDLQQSLRSRVLDTASRQEGDPRIQALAWFDLGLFMLNMEIVGHPQQGKMWAYFEKAGRLQPTDPGLQMCLFAAGFSHRKPVWWKPRLTQVLSHVGDLPKQTRKNLLVLTRRFLGIKSMEELREGYGPAKAAKKG